MLGVIKLFFTFIIATVLHWAFATAFANIGIQVNLMFVFALAACALLKPSYGYALAFLCGLFLDFFGTKLFGNNAFTFCALACVVYAVGERFDFESILPQMLSVLLGSLAAVLMSTLLVHIFAGASVWLGWWSWLGGSVTNALLAPAVFLFLRRIFSKGFVSKEA